MAYFKISTDKKGKLKAKIQALGRDPETDKQKVCYKLVKNDNDLTPAKFHKYVEKCAIEFEEELAKIKFEYISTSYDTTVTATPSPSN